MQNDIKLYLRHVHTHKLFFLCIDTEFSYSFSNYLVYMYMYDQRIFMVLLEVCFIKKHLIIKNAIILNYSEENL